MNISRDSWHYIMVWEILEWPPSRSLCLYFWQVVAGVVLIPIMVISGIFLLVLLLVSLSVPIITLLGYAEPPVWLFWFCVLLWSVPASGLFQVYRAYFPEKHGSKKPPSLLAEFIAAKKEKICPTIQFVE